MHPVHCDASRQRAAPKRKGRHTARAEQSGQNDACRALDPSDGIARSQFLLSDRAADVDETRTVRHHYQAVFCILTELSINKIGVYSRFHFSSGGCPCEGMIQRNHRLAEMPKTNTPREIDAGPRKASREMRRQQFIEATIATLARNGYARTTLTDVARAAGLSHGLIIFHFDNKEKLLAETLVYLAREYRDNWMQALAAAPNRPAARLEALFRADFTPTICNAGRLGAWSALWGEIQSRPIYREHGVDFDLQYAETVRRLCADLIEEGGYPFDVEAVARVIRVSLEGLWLELMNTPEPYPVQDALDAMFQLAMAFFPKHFGKKGAL